MANELAARPMGWPKNPLVIMSALAKIPSLVRRYNKRVSTGSRKSPQKVSAGQPRGRANTAAVAVTMGLPNNELWALFGVMAVAVDRVVYVRPSW